MVAMSILAEVLFGGSVLGPLLFVMCASTVQQPNVSMHSYKDNAQLYVGSDHKDPSGISKAMKSLECCIFDIRIWILRNRLKMNDSKRQMIDFSLPHVKHSS